MSVFESIQKGDALPAHTVRMDRERYFAYNDLVKEINPLHFNEEYARKIGFRAPIVAGDFSFSFIPALIEKWAGKPGCCRRIEVRFINPIYIDDDVKVTGKIVKKYEDNGRKMVDCDVYIEEAGSPNRIMIEASVTVNL